jgi:serine/threonine protein kinase
MPAAQQHQHGHKDAAPAVSEPAFGDSPVNQHHAAHDAYSVGGGDARNRVAQAGNMAAHHAEADQSMSKAKSKRIDDSSIAKLVAEENDTKNKFPRYPGLERWELVEKMGDGAFSNVYRARDLEGNAGEVAIKVVRKYEMNSMQVCAMCYAGELIVARSSACPVFLMAISSLFIFVFTLESPLPTPGDVTGQQASTSGFQAKGSQSCRGASFSFLSLLSFPFGPSMAPTHYTMHNGSGSTTTILLSMMQALVGGRLPSRRHRAAAWRWWLTHNWQRANILKEVQIMRQLDHPNIIKLIDFSESRQYYYIILELAQGGELFHQIVRLTYFSEDLSRHVITQVATALEYLHEEKGVVHRYVNETPF